MIKTLTILLSFSLSCGFSQTLNMSCYAERTSIYKTDFNRKKAEKLVSELSELSYQGFGDSVRKEIVKLTALKEYKSSEIYTLHSKHIQYRVDFNKKGLVTHIYVIKFDSLGWPVKEYLFSNRRLQQQDLIAYRVHYATNDKAATKKILDSLLSAHKIPIQISKIIVQSSSKMPLLSIGNLDYSDDGLRIGFEYDLLQDTRWVYRFSKIDNPSGSNIYVEEAIHSPFIAVHIKEQKVLETLFHSYFTSFTYDSLGKIESTMTLRDGIMVGDYLDAKEDSEQSKRFCFLCSPMFSNRFEHSTWD